MFGTGRVALAAVVLLAIGAPRPLLGASAPIDPAAPPDPPSSQESDRSSSPKTDTVVEPQIVKRGQPGVTISAGEAKTGLMVASTVRAAMSTASAGLHAVTLAGPAGGVGLDLQGRFQTAIVATKGPDGRWVLTCASGLLDQPAVTGEAEEKKP